jgi:TrmH family RNA methyltransferase
MAFLISVQAFIKNKRPSSENLEKKLIFLSFLNDMKIMNKNELKYIQSFAHKKHWAQESVYIIEGPKMLEEAIKAKCVIEKIYATKEWQGNLGNSGGDIEEVDDIMLGRLSHLQTPNQVIALAQKQQNIAPIDYAKQLTLVLDGIQDPGNLGTIIRTADWFGLTDILVTDDTAGLYNPKVIQSTMGSCFRVKVHIAPVEKILSKEKLPVIGTLLSGASIYTQKLPTNGFLVIGNESKGIRSPIQSLITHAVSIPNFGGAESLNAAVATGIVLSHWKQ